MLRKFLHLALIVGLLAASVFAAKGYYSNYYLVAAKRGEKSLADYERLLRDAVNKDKSNGRARMELAWLLFARKQYEQAYAEQVVAMKSFQPLTAVEHLGSMEEKLAESEQGEGRSSHINSARKQFERTERLQPGNVTALEHQMLMAYRSGDDVRLEQIARQVTRADADNVNATYVTAMAAERAGNYRAAYGRYQKIATIDQLPKGALFTTGTVTQRLKQIRSRLEREG